MSSRRQRITPTQEQAFGKEDSLGTSQEFARRDHTHGTMDNPIDAHLSASDPHAQYLRADGGRKVTGNLDINYRQLLRAAIHNDVIANIPVTGNEVEGQQFLANDICTLFVYCDGAWQPLQSFDAVTLYVDGTLGTDAVGKGYTSGTGAVKTRQYAWNLIPGTFGGNVTIQCVNMSADTSISVLNGKTPSGNYTITWLAALPAADVTGTATSGTAYAMGAAGNGANQATLVDTTKSWGIGTVEDSGTADGTSASQLVDSTQNFVTTVKIGMVVKNTTDSTWAKVKRVVSNTTLQLSADIMVSGEAYQIGWGEQVNKLVRITGGTGAGQERVIDSNFNDTLHIAGVWDTTPNATSTYAIYDMDSFETVDFVAQTGNKTMFELIGQKNVYFKYLNFKDFDDYALYAHDYSSLGVISCAFQRSRASTNPNSGIQFSSFSSLITFESSLLNEISNSAWTRGIRFETSAAGGTTNIRNVRTYRVGVPFIIAVSSFTALQTSGGGWCCRSPRISALFGANTTRADVYKSIITGAGANGINCFQHATLLFRMDNEISGCTTNGILVDQESMVQYVTGGSAVPQINYNGGWGILATNLSLPVSGVSSISFTGNTSGSYVQYADASKIKIGAGTAGATHDFEIGGTFKSGGATDYFEVEADGTVHFVNNATVWRDDNFSAVSLGVGASPPDLIALNGGTIYVRAFDGMALTEQLFFATEYNHEAKQGADIIFHVHWSPTTAGAGNVKWQLTYKWISHGTGFSGAETTITVTQAASGVAWDDQKVSFPTVSGTGQTIGSQIVGRFFRDPTDAADTYAADAAITGTFGYHYEIDTIGSRGTVTK